jgi:ABC-type transport system involved in multi-copper enzyme maturation permease subunit
MMWVAWRQQRTETLIAVALLAALAALLIPTGLHMASAYHNDGLSACLSSDSSMACNDAIGSFTSRFEGLVNLVAWFTLLPGLIGVLLAAPFVLELETGTHRLAWTQSITRRRWIVSKLALAVAAALLVTLALILITTWWRAPFVRVHSRLESSAFDSEGTVALGYTLFALGSAALAGAIWRRAVPALVVAFGAYFAARIFVDSWLRQRLASPISVTWPGNTPDPARLAHAWVLNEYPSDRLGHHVMLSRACFSNGNKLNCLAKPGAAFHHAVYIPASHFWALQGIETALFGGVAVVLLAAAALWTHARA